MDIAQLGLSIDSSSAVKATGDLNEFTASATRAAGAQAALAGSSASAASAQASAAASVSAASSSVSTAADRMIEALEKQIALFSANESAIANYNGAMASMTSAELQHYQAQTQVLSQLQAESEQLAQFYAVQEAGVAAGAKFIASLTMQAETIGMSKTELMTYKAEQLGVADAAAPLIASIEAQTAAMAEAAVAATALGESEGAAATRLAAMVEASLAAVAVFNDTTVASAAYAASIDELAAAATLAEKAGVSMNVAAEQTAATQAAAAATIDAASTTISAAAAKVAEALGRQLVALTATRAEMVEYDAAMAGFTETEIAQVSAIAMEIDARKAQIAAGTEMAAVYAAEATAASGASLATAGVTREVVTLGKEAANGDFSRFAGSFTRLLTISGALDAAFSPLGILILSITAAFTVLGIAAIKGAEQFTAFENAVILTGNSAGTSADQLQTMAEGIQATGERIGVAITALTQLTETGKFTSAQILLIGTAATEMSDATGDAVGKTVDAFVKLSEDPVKASIALNNQYHYLTLAVFEQIDALAKQGDAADAVDVAEKAYAASLSQRAGEIQGNLGTLGIAWKSLGDAASAAWNSMLNIGKPQTVQSQLDQVDKALAEAAQAQAQAKAASQRGDDQSASPVGNTDQLRQQQANLQEQLRMQQRGDDAQAADASSTKAAIAAKLKLDQLDQEFDKRSKLVQILTQERAANAALAVKDPNDPSITPDAIATREAAITKRETQRTPKDPVPRAQDQQDQSALKDQYNATEKADSDSAKVLDSQHKARLVSDENFYAQEKALNDKDLSDKLAYYAALEALLKQQMASSTTSAAQKVKDQTMINSLESDAQVARASAAAKDIEISDAQVEASGKQTKAVQTYIDALNKQFEAQQRASDAKLAGVGMGSREGALAGQDAKTDQQGADQIAKLQAQFQAQLNQGPVSSSQYDTHDKEVAAVQTNTDRIKALNHATDDAMTADDANWENGAKTAWANWADNADNTSKQVGTAFTGLMDGMTTQFVNLAVTGKANFLGLAISFTEALAKMEIQAAESSVFKLIQTGVMGLLGGGGIAGAGGTGAEFGGSAAGIGSSGVSTSFAGSALGYADGGHVSGPGTSTSDSIHAKLSDGEFVVNAVATKSNRSLLEAMNGGANVSPGKTHFANGGVVSSPSVSGGSTAVTFNIDNSNTGAVNNGSAQGPDNSSKSAAMQKELESSVIEIVRKHSQPGGQINKIIKSVGS